MEFDPANPIIRLCILGIGSEANGRRQDAETSYRQAWSDAANDFEKYLSAFFVAKIQTSQRDKLDWFQTALRFAESSNSISARSAYSTLYRNMAGCYNELADPDNAKKFLEMAASIPTIPADDGPFYHGTRADIQTGELLTPGILSNYESGLVMNHIYFTAMANGAGLAAALAKGEGRERVYVVEPTGEYEHDPNVTDKKFPGNPTRSYRSAAPLRIIGEVTEWNKQTPEQVQQWQSRLATNSGKIIN